MSATDKTPATPAPTGKAIRDSLEQPTRWGGALDPRLARL
jgi:hypothetical protein